MTQTDDILEHYGIKGMKWGVRRTDAQLARAGGKKSEKMTRRRDARGDLISKDDRKWQKAAGKTKVGIQAYNEAAGEMNARHIGRINSKKRYQGDLFAKGREKDLADYMGEMESAFVKEYTASLSKAFGESPSGKYKVVPARGANGPAWTIEYTDKAKHADTGVRVDLVQDEEGHILSVKVVGDLEHSDILEHYGIKGMKWGVRRTRAQIDADSADAATKKATQAKIKKNSGSTDPLSNAELKALNERLQLEQNYNQLITKEKANAPQSRLSKGGKWAGKFVADVAQQQAKGMANALVKEALTQQAIKKGLLPEKKKKKKE